MTSTAARTGVAVGPLAGWRVYTEDWDPAYGTPATFDFDDSEDVTAAEDGSGHVAGVRGDELPLCFIDGRRQVELSMWLEQAATGSRIPGLDGSFAVGAVAMRPGKPASFEGIRVGRVAIWGGGHDQHIVGQHGFRWASEPTAAVEPDQLLARLQDLMRQAEGDLAFEAASSGWYTVLDGPLNRIRSIHNLVTGYVKTHRRQILPAADHALVPTLAVGHRTRLYTAGSDRYTCYVRVGNPGPGGSPWTGIARLDFPAVAGIDAIIERATQLAGVLPGYAGVAHRDPRAPVNLTPVKNLENHLGAKLWRVRFATRAARDAVIAGASQ